MANGQLIVKLTVDLMRRGETKSWSHAMALAAEEVKRRTATPEGRSLQAPAEQGSGENR